LYDRSTNYGDWGHSLHKCGRNTAMAQNVGEP
jgi:hypothetical protein